MYLAFEGGTSSYLTNIESKQAGKKDSLSLLKVAAYINIIQNHIPGLPTITDHDDRAVGETELFKTATLRMTRYAKNLNDIGLNATEHVELYSASFSGDMRTAKKLIKKSEKRIGRSRVKHSWSPDEAELHHAKHKKLVENLLQGIPRAKDVCETQKILILAGPYASGKTEVFTKAFENNNMLSIDLDLIRKLLKDDYNSENQLHIEQVRRESWIVSDLLAKEALRRGISIIMQSALHRKSNWMNDETLRYAKENNIPIEINMILRPVTECMTRNLNRPRSVAMKDLYTSMNGVNVLIKLVQKYGNIAKVRLIDFYPLLRSQQMLSPKAFKYYYEKLIAYAKKKPEIFSIEIPDKDLEVHQD